MQQRWIVSSVPNKESADESLAERRVTRAELAAICGVHARRVLEWQSQGMPHESHGRGRRTYYPLGAAVAWKLARSRLPSGDDEPSPRRENAQWAAMITRIRAETLAGQRVEVAVVEGLINELGTLFLRSLDGIAGRVAEGDAELRDRILAELGSVRHALARRLESLASDLSAGAPDRSAAEADALGVGRGATGATARHG